MPKNPRLREILCRQKDLPVDVEYLEADALTTAEGELIPMEALLLALYRKHQPQRHIHAVLRELDALVPLHSSVGNPVVEPDGLLAPEVEQRGYKLTTVIKDGDRLLADVGWRPTPTAAPIHAGLTEFQQNLVAQFLPTGELGVTQLLAADVQRTAISADQLLSDKGRQLLTTLFPATTGKTRQTQKRGHAETDGGAPQ